MKASAAMETGRCTRCGKNDVLLVGQSATFGGMVCDPCFTVLNQADLPLDDYDLQPGELTKEMVADMAQVTPRAVEMWKAQGKLPAVKVRRRIVDTKTGQAIVRKQLIFKAGDVESFLREQDAPVQLPSVVTETAALATHDDVEMVNAAQMFMMEKMAQIGESFQKAAAQLSGAAGPERKPFISIKEAADEYDLSVAGIKHLIAEGVIRALPGKNGKQLVSRNELERL